MAFGLQMCVCVYACVCSDNNASPSLQLARLTLYQPTPCSKIGEREIMGEKEKIGEGESARGNKFGRWEDHNKDCNGDFAKSRY